MTDYARHARSENTHRAYESRLARFEAWRAGRPVSGDVVARYLGELAESGAKVSSVRAARTAICAAYPEAHTRDVRETMAGVRRVHASEPLRRARPLTERDALDLMARGDARRAAAVALLFCGALRRSEAAALDWRDVEWSDIGAKVRIRQSKTNPFGAGPDVRLLAGSFRSVLAACWIAAGRPAAGPVLGGVCDRTVNRWIQRLAGEAGLAGVSSHSGRRGLATELIRAGCSTTAVQQAGAWSDPRQVSVYAADAGVETGAVAQVFGRRRAATRSA